MTTLNLCLNNCQLKYVSNINFLGIIIDDTLSWKTHIQHIGNKLSKTCGVLCTLKRYLPTHILKLIYCSLILPHLYYGAGIWSYRNCHRIKTLQKQALRHVNLSKYNAHSQPLCAKLGVLLFDDICNLTCLKMAYNIFNRVSPLYFQHKFLILEPLFDNNDGIRTLNIPAHLRDFATGLPQLRSKIPIPRSKKNLTQNCIRFYIPKLINNATFPMTVLEKMKTHSLSGFTNYAKKYLISNYNTRCELQNCFSCCG